MITFAVRGDVAGLGAAERSILFDRSTSEDAALRAHTASIIARVRAEGDAALHAFAWDFDGAVLTSLEVPRTLWKAARDGLEPALRRALERASENIRAAHEAFRPAASEFITADGVVIGRRPDPLGRVGVYAPGGKATYPSSVLMGVTPARVAGVAEIILCSPPGPSGRPSDVVLAAAAIAGADRVFAVGGAGAVAAMAYGTATIPRVDRIVGPGNAYVAEAKLQVGGAVAIDSPAGPSELLVVADDSADADVAAREIVAQAEHDPRAAVVLVTSSPSLAPAVASRIERYVATAPRAAIIRDALASRGGLLSVGTLGEAEAFASRYAAEHVLVLCREPDAVAGRIRNAGTIFIGTPSSVAFGDYLTGANHVLPTGGLARSYSGLSTVDFCRWTTWQRVDRSAATRLASDVGLLADAEQLPGHAADARHWVEVAR